MYVKKKRRQVHICGYFWQRTHLTLVIETVTAMFTATLTGAQGFGW